MINSLEETELLKKAIEALHRETGLQVRVKKEAVKKGTGKIGKIRIDALATLKGDRKQFAIEVKRWAAQTPLGALINKMQEIPMETMLAADFVNPNMAVKLRENNIQFFDMAGNAYINQPPTYIYIKGNRLDNEFVKEKKRTGRAFEPAGLKVVYALLCDPELIKRPYRTIAEKAQVVVGTVGEVVKDLKANNYVIDRGDKVGRRLTQYKPLLDRWVETYPNRLKPKQIVGDYATDKPDWWKKINLKKYQGYWGGEVAAAKYTQYLTPHEFTLFLTKENEKAFFIKARLRKMEEGLDDSWYRVTIFRPFWTPADNIDAVHPVLAYADLIATGDIRNIETAQIIYEKYIAQDRRDNR